MHNIKSAIATLAALGALVVTAHAALTVVGTGNERTFDPASFPADKQQSYALMEAKCANASCHSMDRTVEAVTSGVMPLSKKPFDHEAAKAYGIKMMRMPSSGINKAEAKELVELMYFMIDESKK